jgi:hypothetical protein
MSYYIGLSILSNITGKHYKGKDNKKLLSREAMHMVSGLEGGIHTEDDIAKGEQGRPFYKDHSEDFNISHSGALTAVTFVRGEKLRTGCDVELMRPRTRAKKIAEDFFSAPERDYIFPPHGRFDERRFYKIWTLKECYLKLCGLTVFDMGTVPSFICGQGSCRGHFVFDAAVSAPISFYLYEISGNAGERYMLAAAFEGGTKTKDPEIRWFSQGSLPCRSIAIINAALNPIETERPKR